MIKISNSKLISIFTKLLVLLAFAKTISLALWWYLPSGGVELTIKENYQPKYQRVNFKNMIQKIKVVKEDTQITKESDVGISITNMILKGLYGTKEKGFVIVAMKSKPKETDIVGVGENYKGYKLKFINAFSVTFEKDFQDYVLELEKIEKKVKNSISKRKNIIKKASQNSDDSANSVSRKDIKYYADNPKQIWKDISIKELRDGKKLTGFKVTKIKPKSRFATLGLQKNDVIIKANNIKLQSYRDALEIYKGINKLDTIQVVVLRNNQEVELVYEIN